MSLVHHPLSRRRFVAAGATGTASAALVACGGEGSELSRSQDVSSTTETTTGDAGSKFGEGDAGIVNYALTLEFLEASFYEKVVSSGMFKGTELALLETIRDHERIHAEELTKVAKSLGDPVPKPQTEFPIDSRDQVLELASTFESTGVGAYLDQAPKILSKQILASAATIVTVEGRHSSAINLLIGVSPTPDGSFDKPIPMDQVLSRVDPYIVD